MLSVGSREDARNGVAFGQGYRSGGVMEENEVEEGEACSSLEYDTTIDPDIALSYIDEKIRDILGHLQRDFEGGVSAENLGAKFGGYGSFLPTYPRSPTIWSHSRSPERVPDHNNPISPCTPPAEGAYHKPVVPVSASASLKNNSIPEAPQLDEMKRNETCISAPFFGEFTPQYDMTNKPSKGYDQKILKVRIKVGSDNVLSRANAAIYSDMGLDYSPSLSLEDSPGASGGFSLETRDSCGESPMSVLKIMTCFPVAGGYVLSPLPDSVLHLMENERLYLRDCKLGTFTLGVETRDVVKSDTLPASNGKVLLGRKAKNVEKNMRSSEIKNLNCDADPMNETDVQMPVGRMRVSDALNTPILTNSGDADEKPERQPLEEAMKGSGISREPNNILIKDRELSCDLLEEEPLEDMPSLDTGMFDTVRNDYLHLKGKLDFGSRSSDKVLEQGQLSNHKGAQFDLHNKGRGAAEKNCDAFNSATDILKGRKDIVVEQPAAHIKLKAPQKSTLHEGEGEKMLQARDHSSGKKRKMKGSDGMPCVDNPKENIKVSSSVSLMEKKKSSHSNRDHSEDKQNALKSYKESSRILCKAFDSLEEAKDEPLEYGSDLSKNIFRDKTKDSRIGNEKDTSAFAEKAREKSSVKNVENPPMSEAYGKGFCVLPSMANGSTSDAASAPSSHVVIQENWVCCDRCHKWRLLPYGTDPAHLPNKWLCTMLNWLPGMNKCSSSEEETTRALHALYQAPLPENQSATVGPNSEVTNGAVSNSVQHVDQNHVPSLHIASSHENKKNTSKDVPCQAMLVCNSARKDQHFSIKSRSLSQNQVESNASGKSSFQHVNKSIELSVEKVDERQKKHKMVERCSNGGEFFEQKDQPSKSKGKRGSDQDGLKTSKKVKTEEAHNGDEDQHSDRDLTGKSVPVLSDGSLSKVTAKSLLDYNDSSSLMDSKCNSKDSLSGSRNKSKASIKVSSNGDCKGHFSTSFVEKCDKKDSSAKKRNVEQQLECQVHPEAVFGSGLLVDVRAYAKEEITESKSRKEKKARIRKTEERESFTIMMDGKIDKKSQVARVLLPSRKEHPLDGMEKGNNGIFENGQRGKYRDSVECELNVDCLGSKRDLSYLQTSTAATSSSSKVSGSPKSKFNFQEARGSPVESVSSSPLRISNVDKFANKKNTVGKDGAVNASFSVLGSSRRCLDGEVVGQIDRCGTFGLDKSSSVVYNQSLGGYPDVDFEVMDPVKGASDYLDRKASSMPVGKVKVGIHLKSSRNLNDDALPPEFEENNLVAGDDNQGKNCGCDPEKQKNHYHSKCCDRQKSRKNSSLRPKDKQRSSKSDVDKCKVKRSDSFSEKEDTCPAKNGDSFRYDADMDSHNPSIYHEDLRVGRCKGVEKDKKKRESVGKWSSECRRGDKSNFGVKDNLEDNNLLAKQHRDLHSRVNEAGTVSAQKMKSCLHDNPQKIMPHEDKRLSNCVISDQTKKLDTAPEKGKSQPLPHSGDKQLQLSQDPRTVLSNTKGARSEVSSADVMIGDASKVLNQPKTGDSQNGRHHSSSLHMITNGFDAPSPVRRDGNHPAASVVLKEARDLKHRANRLKSEGLEYESTGLYFEAALKFLHVASLLESSSAESGKHVESTQSMIMYSETAKLCEFCAHEYEKLKEMAAVALAYKCMEVAYMKVVFSKHSCASKDRHELQTALHMVPSGESPSSSASDIDNVNNQNMLDKTASVKGVNSPQTTGTHVIAARNRPTFVRRLLNFVQDVNYAMEASRKSHNAFRAANDSPEESHCGPEEIASVRRVLDFSFHDVEGLLHLVRLSMDSISR